MPALLLGLISEKTSCCMSEGAREPTNTCTAWITREPGLRGETGEAGHE